MKPVVATSRGLWVAAAMTGILWLPGCGAGSADAPARGRFNDPLNVVATTGQVADMLEHIGGQHVTIKSLMGPGVDPHLYKATPGDVRALNSADVVFYSGLHLEGRLASLLENLARRKPAFAVTDGIQQKQPELLHAVPGSEGHYDPHVWFDVSLWARTVDYAAGKLMELDPDHAQDYRRNADAYLAELTDLHAWCKKHIGEIPKEQRVLVTAHDAFGYFGTAYDIEVHGLQGISTADEPDLGAVNALVEMLTKRKIKAVFVESSVPPRNVQALIEACAGRGHEVRIGGELFSDAMGPEGTPAETYVGMVKHNVNTVVEALK